MTIGELTTALSEFDDSADVHIADGINLLGSVPLEDILFQVVNEAVYLVKKSD